MRPLIIINARNVEFLKKLQILMALIKRTMKNIHQIAIEYLTHLVPNKRKLDNKQEPIHPPPSEGSYLISNEQWAVSGEQ